VSRVAKCRDPQLAYAGGWRGHQNLGDESLFEGMGKIFPSFKLVPVRGERYETSVGKILPDFQAAVLAGGTLINKRGSLPIAEAYSLRMKPFFVFGTGVASPDFWIGRWTDRGFWRSQMHRWEPILRRCIYVGVRGPVSAACLKDYGIGNVEIVGDPVVALAGSDTRTEPAPRTVGLNLGVSGGQVWGIEERITDEYLGLAQAARKHGWEVHWFVVWPGDLEVVLRIAERSGTARHIHRTYTDPYQYLHLVGRISVFFGMKLHAVVLATCAFVPAIMLEYRPKCRDYMASLGEEHLVVRSDRFSGTAVWERLIGMAQRRESISEDLRTKVLALRDLQRERAAEVVNRICESAL